MAESDNIKKIQMSELQSNLELNKLLLKYISQEYAQNDTAVIANLLDVSKKIILPEDKLEDLIKVALNDPNVKVEINTTKKQQSCNCCGKCKMNLHLFANIISIMVDGRSLRTVQPYVTEFLEDSCSVSLSRTYIREFIKIERINPANTNTTNTTNTEVQEKNINKSSDKSSDKSVSDIPVSKTNSPPDSFRE